MKIVMVISGLKTGGAEMSLLSLVSRLREHCEVCVVSLSGSGSVGKMLQEAGVPLHTLQMRSIASAPVVMLRLVRLLRRLRPDVVHTWMYHADFIGGLAAHLAGAPAVAWSIHSFNIAEGMLKPATRFLVKACAALSGTVPTKIISCSEAGVAVHVKAGYCPSKFVFIPNGVDMSRFKFIESASTSVREELGIPASARIVGVIGRFDVQKNQIGFFEAASAIHERCPDVHFVLAGREVDGANESLVRAIVRAGVGGATRLLGARDDIPRLVSALDVLASPSYGEAFPLVLIEAMACGVPCAVTNVGDCGHMVGDSGHVVEAGDMKGLADAVCGLLELPSKDRRALAARAIASVHEKYNLDKVVDIYINFYRTISRSGPAKST